MATLAELQGIVARIVDDDSYTTPIIKDYLNQSVTDICGGVPVIWPDRPGDQTMLEPLDSLYTIGTVDTTSTYRVALPSDYQREVVFVAHEDGYELKLYSNFGDFRRSFPLLDNSGSVIAVAVKDTYLYYQSIPSAAETLTVHYYAAPTAMAADSDEPEGVPERFHKTLIVYDTCLRIFRELYEEDMARHGVIQAYQEKRMAELVALASSQESDHGSVVFKCG